MPDPNPQGLLAIDMRQCPIMGTNADRPQPLTHVLELQRRIMGAGVKAPVESQCDTCLTPSPETGKKQVLGVTHYVSDAVNTRPILRNIRG